MPAARASTLCWQRLSTVCGTEIVGLAGFRPGDGDTVRAAAVRCGIAVSTAFRWRHRWLKTLKSGTGKLASIVEADETFVLFSRKGERNLGRKPRKRGGEASPPNTWRAILIGFISPDFGI